MRISLFAWLLLAVCALSLAGCGGGGNRMNQPVTGLQSGQGRVTLTVTWPKPTRLIPQAAGSIRAELTLGNLSVGSQLMARPVSGNTSTVTFNNVAVGTLTLTATALPNADGTGTAQAQGSAPVIVIAGATSPVSVTMASTIDHLELTRGNPIPIAFGQNTQVTVTAKDSAGSVVLLSAGQLSWDTADHSIATVTATGLVAGIKLGTTSITVRDAESQKSVTGNLVVQPIPLVWFRAENNALDSGSGGDNGSVAGNVGYGPGQSGQGFVFDGVGGGINLGDPNNLKITGSFTIDCWVKVNGLPSPSQVWGMIYFRGDDRGGFDPVYLGVKPDGTLEFEVDETLDNHAQLDIPMTLGVLQHLTCTFDGASGDMRLYVNGQLQQQTTTPFRPFRDLDPQQIGGDAVGNVAGFPRSGYNYTFNGTIDEFKIYTAVVPP